MVSTLRKTNKILKKDVTKSDLESDLLLNSIVLPSLNYREVDICESKITEKNLTTALKSMPHGKFPGHDGLTRILCTLLRRYKSLFSLFLETI